MIHVFIGLGANIQHPGSQLQRATAQLAQHPGCELIGCSRVYESPPMGPQDQPNFLNAVLRLATSVPPVELLEALQSIERELGRVKVRHWGERCIDLDLLMYGQGETAITMTSESLTLPHPGIYDRDFVLRPLHDLVGPHYQMPNGEEIGTLLAACSTAELAVVDLDLNPAQRFGERR